MHSADLVRLYAPLVMAMAALQFGVLTLLGTLRLLGLVRHSYSMRYFRLMQRPEGAQLPERAEAASRNFANLFEMPVLFYALVPLLVLAGIGDRVVFGALCGFVGLRYAHSAIHLTVNDVRLRFAVYALSCMALLIAWIRFAVRLF